jgi:oxygen-independent coproporphyrinogen-3 oxidase
MSSPFSSTSREGGTSSVLDLSTGAAGSETARSLAHGIALYLHIPFCQTKCPYCDFNTYAGIAHLLPSYLDALAAELRLWGGVLGHPHVNTVFLGGGTPSLLTPPQLRALLDAVREAFPVRGDAEVTAEANPDDVTAARVEGFLEAGVNRVSMGVQSLDPDLLRLLGRRHGAAEAIRAYHCLREAGCHNVSLDLMYGLPFQTLAQWQSTLAAALELAPEHLSAYCLTLEDGTPMERQVREGGIPEPDPDLAATMYEAAHEFLAHPGYRGYEISNWARHGFESRHNLTYWRNLPYLGVGPGAHSYLGGCRFGLVTAPVEYIQRVKQWAAAGPQGAGHLGAAALQRAPTVATLEAVDLTLEMAETLMLGLRLEEGVGFREFRERFRCDLSQVYGAVIEEVMALELAEVRGEGEARRLGLTPRGQLLGNQVFLRFLRPGSTPSGSLAVHS